MIHLNLFNFGCTEFAGDPTPNDVINIRREFVKYPTPNDVTNICREFVKYPTLNQL